MSALRTAVPLNLEPASAAAGTILHPRALVVRLGAPHHVLSWAIEGGGLRRADTVAWIEVTNDELSPPVDARIYLKGRLAELGIAGAVGMLTSRTVGTFEDVSAHEGDVSARCIATVGLGNALRVGDPIGPCARIGTINLLCVSSLPLDDGGLVEAMSIAVEARTAAIVDAGIASRRTGDPATGTGTDCVTIAAPLGRPHRYAGKHTAIGSAIGRSVLRAIGDAAEAWKKEQRR